MTPEEQAAIDAQIKEATDRLEAKNKALLKELKEARGTLKNFDGVDLEALNKIAEDHKKLTEKNLEEQGAFKKLHEDLKQKYEKDVALLSEEKQKLAGSIALKEKSEQLTAALAANKAIPELLGVAKGTLLGSVELDDNNKAVIDGVPVSDFVADWTKTDVGKHFTLNGNSGGGGGGGGGNPDDEAKFFDKKSPEYNLTAQAKIASKDPDRYKALKKQFS